MRISDWSSDVCSSDLGLWAIPDARAALQTDLVATGVQQHASTWSLTQAATLRDALMVLPALALFVAVLGVDATTQRRLLILFVALPLARQSVVWGTSVSVRVDLGGRRFITKQT